MKPAYLITASLLLFLFCQTVAAEENKTERFQGAGNSLVVDLQTGLMWATHDNGQDIDWWGAKKFCEDFTAGGYTDWRLPDIKELATLYTSGKSNKDGYFIAGPITITEGGLWSSYDTMGGALIFNFKTGKKPAGYLADRYQLRALPVRGTSTIDLNKYKNFANEK